MPICKYGRCGAIYHGSKCDNDGLCPQCAEVVKETQTGGPIQLTQPTYPEPALIDLEEPKVDKRKWCWGQDGDETCHGPFNCREEAIEDAASDIWDLYDDGIYEILVGHCNYFDPIKHAGTAGNMENILYDMEESATDECNTLEDEIFITRKGAEEAFRRAIVGWAEIFVYSESWMMENVKKTFIEIVTGNNGNITHKEYNCPICKDTGRVVIDEDENTTKCDNCTQLTEHEKMLAQAMGCPSGDNW